jgi:FtsH-binding integral membrane protein
VFFITSATFGAMSLYGYYTKSDLTKWKNILFTAFIGIVIAGLINVFWQNDTFSFFTSCLGVLIFSGMIAYTSQDLKYMAEQLHDESSQKKYAIIGALSLYISFINLFMSLLRIFGDRD